MIFDFVIPALSSWLDGFGSWLPGLFAFGVLMAIPPIIKEVASYV